MKNWKDEQFIVWLFFLAGVVLERAQDNLAMLTVTHHLHTPTRYGTLDSPQAAIHTEANMMKEYEKLVPAHPRLAQPARAGMELS